MKMIQMMLAVPLAICFAPLAMAAEGDISGFLVTVSGFFEAFPAWLTAITTVVTAATAITALTPSKTDDEIVNKVLKVLNFLAGNFLKNKNADDK